MVRYKGVLHEKKNYYILAFFKKKSAMKPRVKIKRTVRKATPAAEMELPYVVKQQHVICAGGLPKIRSRKQSIVFIFICVCGIIVREKEKRFHICYIMEERGGFREVWRVMKAIYEEYALLVTREQDGHRQFRREIR